MVDATVSFGGSDMLAGIARDIHTIKDDIQTLKDDSAKYAAEQKNVALPTMLQTP